MSAEWQFVITLTEHLRPLRDPLEIQATALRLLCEHLQANRVSFAYIDGNDFAVSRSYVRDGPPLVRRGPLARFGSHHLVARVVTLAVGCASTVLGIAWGYPLILKLSI